VFRSDSLHHLHPEDMDAFDALGVQAICDLRREAELVEAPGPSNTRSERKPISVCPTT
jgi:hypothetical protein